MSPHRSRSSRSSRRAARDDAGLPNPVIVVGGLLAVLIAGLILTFHGLF